MQELGIIRKIDDTGRVVIPVEVRKELNWEYHTPLELFFDKSGVLLRTYKKSCIFCGGRDIVRDFEGRLTGVIRTCLKSSIFGIFWIIILGRLTYICRIFCSIMMNLCF